MVATRTRIIDAILKAGLKSRPNSNPPFLFSRCRACAVAFLCRWLSVMNISEDSMFANVRSPTTIGSVAVGSTCTRLVSVNTDSESKGVGARDRSFKTILVPMKRGNCDTIGRRRVKLGRQSYLSSNSFSRGLTYKE